MAFANNITLDDQSGDDVTYVLISTSQDGTVRLDNSTTLATPGKMAIRHSVTGGNGNTVDRHLVQFTRDLAGSSGTKQAIVNFTMAVPRDAVVTNQVMFDLVANLIDFLVDGALVNPMTSTALTALLRGES